MKQTIISLLMLLLPVMANAEEVEIDGICYNLITKAQLAEVKSGSGCFGDIVIPSSFVYNDVTYTVTAIEKNAFYNCIGLTSVTIPNSVTSIEIGAFSGCYRLTAVHITDLDAWCKIEFAHYYSNPLFYAQHLYLNGKEIKELVIPNSVPAIGANAFYNCTGLTSVTIPNSVTSIGNNAFYNCYGLTFVTIPNSVTSIGNNAFFNCYGLTSVTIPNSVTSIEESAFSSCAGLISVTIPNSVTAIGGSAFKNCKGLTSVTIPNSVTSIGISVFYQCSGLTSVTIPNSITSIRKEAFYGCSGLTSIIIGSGLKQIYENAFGNCLELADVYCYAENVPSTNTAAFDGSYIEYATLHVPASAVDAYSKKAPWSNFKYKVAIGEQEQYYALTYMLDGTKYREYSLQEGETITPDPAPIKEGFTFSGWSEIPATMPDHDITVTGTFIANTYLPGDANGDGQITVTDIGVIVDIILGKTPANARKQQEVVPE